MKTKNSSFPFWVIDILGFLIAHPSQIKKNLMLPKGTLFLLLFFHYQ